MTIKRNKPELSRRIIIYFLLAPILSIGILGFFCIQGEYSGFQIESKSMRDRYLSSYKDLLKTEVSTALSYIEYQKTRVEPRLRQSIQGRVNEAHAIASNIFNQYRGKRTPDEMQEMVKDALRSIRFNENRGYFFAFNLQGIETLFADRPEMEGQDMLPVQGAQGEYVVRDMLDIVKMGKEGFYQYTWTKPNREGYFPKIAFVKLFEPFGWVLGTGEYLDDVEGDIQKEVIEYIEKIRFGGDGYVFVGQWDGVSLCGPVKGTNMWDVTDSHGTKIVQEMIGLSKEGCGYLEYVMPQLEDRRPAPKLSYAVGIPERKWYVGTGIYIDEIETAIAQRKKEVEQKIIGNLVKIALVLAGAIGFVCLVLFYISRNTRKNLEAFTVFFERAGSELDEINPDEMHYAEMQNLAYSANNMVKARNRAAQELIQAHTVLKTILERSPFGVAVIGRDRKIRWANHYVSALAGVADATDLCGKECGAYLCPASQNECPILDRHQVVDNSERILRRMDGMEIPILKSVMEIEMNGESVLLETFVDITERKLVEEERALNALRTQVLLQLKQMTQATLQEVTDFALEEAIRLTQSTIGYLAFLNDDESILTMHSWSKSAMAECAIADKPIIYPVETTGLWGEAVRQRRPVITNDYTAEGPMMKGYPKGHVAVRRHMNTPVFVGSRIVLVAGVGNKSEAYDQSDVQQLTLLMEGMWRLIERKRAEVALRESEKKYRLIAENTADLISILDMNLRFTYVSPASIRLRGFTVEEAMGQTLDQVLTPESMRLGLAVFKKEMLLEASGTADPDRTRILELEEYKKDGSIVWVEASLSFLRDEDCKPAEILIVSRDITERKQAEEVKAKLEGQLQQAQKFEAIGTLAGGIAHDFNNLLMGIQGRASLLSLNLETSLPHLEHIKAIEEYIRSATNLTKQLLGFARGGKYEVTPIDMNELVRGSSAMFGRTKKEIQIHAKCQQSPIVVEADRGQIEQALLNMYVNAWQAMPPDGGKLYLETKIVTLDKAYCKPHQVEPGQYVKVSITDTGSGMDEATRLRIFDPFFTTKEKSRGTGLGLASAYGIIKNHGGMIAVYSEIGNGTTFNIYLPISDKKAHREIPLESEFIKGSGTILLVDDEEMIIDVGHAMLESLGYRVVVSRGGQEAVKAITDMGTEIDLVILDMIMPGMDGGTTFDCIREIQPGMPVLLSSGYAINGQSHEIMRRGCNGFIQKPYNLSDLSNKVRNVLNENHTDFVSKYLPIVHQEASSATEI